MIICNMTMQVGWNIHDDWIQWMKEAHLPSVMETGSFERYQWSKIKEIDETDGPSYCIQFFVTDEATLKNYLAYEAGVHDEYLKERWGTDCLIFRTIMEVIN